MRDVIRELICSLRYFRNYHDHVGYEESNSKVRRAGRGEAGARVSSMEHCLTRTRILYAGRGSLYCVKNQLGLKGNCQAFMSCCDACHVGEAITGTRWS